MTLSRRRFLKTSTMVAISASIPLEVAQVASAQQPDVTPSLGEPASFAIADQVDSLSYLSQAAFAAYVNSIFVVANGSSKANELTLVSVTDTRNMAQTYRGSRKLAPDAAGKECFSLIFRGAPQCSLRQDVYDVQHVALGNFRLLIVPIFSGNNDVCSYEAIINRSQP